MASFQQSLSPITTNNTNSFSILSSMTPPFQNSVLPQSTSIPMNSTQLSPVNLIGVPSPNSQITAPIPAIQTINTSIPQSSPSFRNTTIPIPQSSPSYGNTIIPIPQSSPSLRIPISQTSTVLRPPSPQIQASPNARTALQNLNPIATSTTSVVIPNLISQNSIPSVQMNNSIPNKDQSRMFPSIKGVSPNSSLPLKPTAELMNQQFEVRDYQGIISNASLENELLKIGYAPISKIVIRTDEGDKRTQYIKAINKMGQTVFILIDVNGYTTARPSDLTLIEAHNASIVPYSLKTGAYNCAGKDVCGVAFECGSDAVCVLARAPDDLTPKEANFVFLEKQIPSVASLETEGTITTYPVIRLSEIRANPILVLQNTDIVTRRLRNSGYTALLQELAVTQQSINKLNEAFVRFNRIREDVAGKLNTTLTQLEQWNTVYMQHPPITDDGKDKYRSLQYNLTLRNENIAVLLRLMKKVADLHKGINSITKEINDMSEFAEKEFVNVDRAVSD